MKAEKVILSFVAVLVGLIAAGVAFYLYQMTRTLPAQKTIPLTMAPKISPSTSVDNGHVLTVDSPSDEQVFDKRTITINGKAESDATIIVSTEDNDQVVTPASNGDFSFTQTIPDGTTLLQISAVYPDGQEKKITRTITFSTESF